MLTIWSREISLGSPLHPWCDPTSIEGVCGRCGRCGFGTAEVFKSALINSLEHGQKGLSVAFDRRPRWYDSDHPMAAGEVGKVGVAIRFPQDMETLFRIFL